MRKQTETESAPGGREYRVVVEYDATDHSAIVAGKWLTKYSGRIEGGYVLYRSRSKNREGTVLWYIKKINNTQKDTKDPQGLQGLTGLFPATCGIWQEEKNTDAYFPAHANYIGRLEQTLRNPANPAGDSVCDPLDFEDFPIG
ncbi:MAG: hypothetical protein HQL74_11055 [Magnetococcales bacterium]|nr:hypothetical protein [Magnetococcales bacterium]